METEIQTSLRGVWRNSVDGCPHLLPRLDSPDECEVIGNGGGRGLCEYTYPNGHCEIFAEIVAEWNQEIIICPECGKKRPDDDRVKAGMACGICAYSFSSR